jgi:hypothetical protein
MDEYGRVINLFFLMPQSIEMLAQHLSVIFADATYKTNRYVLSHLLTIYAHITKLWLIIQVLLSSPSLCWNDLHKSNFLCRIRIHETRD